MSPIRSASVEREVRSMVESRDAVQGLQDPPDAAKSILVAVDASADASRVVSMAAVVSRSMPQASIHVVHVFRTSRLDRPRLGTPTGNADLIEEAKEQLEYHVRSAQKQSRAQVTSHFAMGDPATEILRLAAELDVDLLVVGTHDHLGVERLLLGSVAETLMRKAGCAVLVVRAKAHRA